MQNIGWIELLVILGVCALCAVPLVAGAIALVVVAIRRKKRA